MVDLEEEQDSKLPQKTEQDWYIDIGEGQVINNIYLFIYNSFNIRSKAVSRLIPLSSNPKETSFTDDNGRYSLIQIHTICSLCIVGWDTSVY